MNDAAGIMTVRGLISADQIGFTLPHEHIYCTLRHADYRYDLGDQFDDEDVMAAEVSAFADLGGATIFDLSVPDNGRSPERLRALSERTGVHFVMGCGWYRGNYYLPEERIDRRSVGDLADELIREITEGVGDTGIRPGVIGEIGSEKTWVSAAEERVLRAVARAHKATGLAIGALHAIGPVAPAQLTILEEEDVDMSRVAVAHCESYPHLPYLLGLLDRGVYIMFDNCGQFRGMGQFEDRILDLIRDLIDRGFEDRLMLSHDVCKLGQLRIHGGTGFVYLSEIFPSRPRLQGGARLGHHHHHPRQSAALVGWTMSVEERLLRWYEGVVGEYRRLTPGSAALFEQGGGVLPGGDTRYSITTRPHPIYFERGEGPYIWDVDGNRRLDLNNNSTALVHGHAHPEIVAAVRAQAGKGTAWGGHNPLEVDWAEMICERVPSIERVRFANSGTEANMHMLKVARAATGRDLVLKLDGAYHGTYDGVEFRTGPGNGGVVPSTGGVPSNLSVNILIGRWGDTEGVARLVRDNAEHLAAVVLTPFRSAGGFAHPPAGFLETLREVTAEEGVLLLFDEVISLRLGMGGAQGRYGVVPDMTALGKLIGGGLPVGAFGGRADIMAVTDPLGDMKVALAGTFNANPMTATAGVAGLRLLTSEVYERLDHLGGSLRSGLAKAIEERHLPLRVEGGGSLLSLACDAGATTPDLLMTGLALAFGNRGVFGFPFMSTSSVMTEHHIDTVLETAATVLDDLATALQTGA